MKVSVEIDCTPEEARVFLGLPDLQPLQQALMQQFEQRLRAAMQAMDPEAMMQNWLPAGIQGVEQWQKMFWSQWQQALTGGMATTAVRKTGNGE